MRTLGIPALAMLLLGSCGESPSMSPRMPITLSPSQVVPGAATGPTRITFVSADPPPGTTVSGCGSDVRACPGRLRMVFRLAPSGSGPVLRFAAFMHSASKRACFVATTASFPLRAGEETSVQVVLDPSDDCPTPLSITDLAATVEGAIEVASRQEWTLGYTFAP
jgi:hypothetical protein